MKIQRTVVLWAALAALAVVPIVWIALDALSSDAFAERERLELLLWRTVNALEAADVTYWIVGGTLVGAYLDARVVLTDYDADLNIPIASLGAFRRVDWRAAGLVCYEGYGGFRVKSWSLDTLRVDIFVRRITPVTHTLTYAWPRLDSAYPLSVTPARLVFPLRRYRVRMFEVYGPDQPHALLRLQYGNYSLNPPKSWREAAWVCVEKQVWARLIPMASYFSPTMPY